MKSLNVTKHLSSERYVDLLISQKNVGLFFNHPSLTEKNFQIFLTFTSSSQHKSVVVSSYTLFKLHTIRHGLNTCGCFCICVSVNILPVKNSPNSCSSFKALSKVFFACSSVSLLFMSLHRRTVLIFIVRFHIQDTCTGMDFYVTHQVKLHKNTYMHILECGLLIDGCYG